MYSSQQISALAIKSVLYSLVIHVVIFSLFIFVIPLKNSPHKPVLVFFGGILKSGEFMDVSQSNQNQSNLILKTDFRYKDSEQGAPYDNRSVTKPPHAEISLDQVKETEKIIHDRANDLNKSNNIKTMDLPNIPTAPKYQSLRFNSK